MMSLSVRAIASIACDTATIAGCVNSVSSCNSHTRKSCRRPRRRQSMPRHEHFEKLCSLAVLGEVSPEEMVELHEHLRRCRQCKTSLADFSSITDDRLPLAARAQFRPGPGVTADGLRKLRESTLGRVADEGLHISPEAIRGPNSRLPRLREWLDELNWSIPARVPRIAMSAALFVIVVIGFGLMRHDKERRQETERLRKDLREAQTAEAT